MGMMFLIEIDAHSEWTEAYETEHSTSQVTIDKLRIAFNLYGLCQTIVSDNAGSNFTSEEFREILRSNGIKHIRVAPYHAASNGVAERAVQLIKDGLRKQKHGNIQQKLIRVLLNYSIMPHTTT